MVELVASFSQSVCNPATLKCGLNSFSKIGRGVCMYSINHQLAGTLARYKRFENFVQGPGSGSGHGRYLLYFMMQSIRDE
jgi:hypothetical protein